MTDLCPGSSLLHSGVLGTQPVVASVLKSRPDLDQRHVLLCTD